MIGMPVLDSLTGASSLAGPPSARRSFREPRFELSVVHRARVLPDGRALLGDDEIRNAAHAEPSGELRMAFGVHLQHERDRKSTRLNSSHVKISYAVLCLKKK